MPLGFVCQGLREAFLHVVDDGLALSERRFIIPFLAKVVGHLDPVLHAQQGLMLGGPGIVNGGWPGEIHQGGRACVWKWMVGMVRGLCVA